MLYKCLYVFDRGVFFIYNSFISEKNKKTIKWIPESFDSILITNYFMKEYIFGIFNYFAAFISKPFIGCEFFFWSFYIPNLKSESFRNLFTKVTLNLKGNLLSFFLF